MTRCFLKRKLREQERELMNGRQAARAAARRIEENERVMALNKRDIIDYNTCILSMIEGETPCIYCEDYNECQLEAKDGKGCKQWMLRSQQITSETVKDGDVDASTGIYGASSEG